MQLKDLQVTNEQELEQINRLQQQVGILKTSIGQMKKQIKKHLKNRSTNISKKLISALDY